MKIVPFHSSFNRSNFNCGKELLNNYLIRQVSQDIRRKLTVCFLLVDDEDNVKGYYTLSNAGIPRDDLPAKLAKKLPRSYQNLPVTLLGRLAIERSVSGQGYGKFILIDALKRCLQVSATSVGSMAVIVDPLDEAAIRFYRKYGFIHLPDSGKMFLPVRTISKLFNPD